MTICFKIISSTWKRSVMLGIRKVSTTNVVNLCCKPGMDIVSISDRLTPAKERLIFFGASGYV